MDQWFSTSVVNNNNRSTNNQREPPGHCWHITEGTIGIVTTKRDVDCSRMGQLNWKTEDGRWRMLSCRLGACERGWVATLLCLMEHSRDTDDVMNRQKHVELEPMWIAAWHSARVPSLGVDVGHCGTRQDWMGAVKQRLEGVTTH